MQHYFVIGASSGIGQALAEQLARDGNQVIATYFKNKPAVEIPNTRFHYLNALEDIHDLDFLPEVLDGFVYCPGSINLRPFTRIDTVDFESDYKLQVTGAIRLLQLVMPRLKRSANGSIIFFSTVAVQTGLPFHTQVASSKGAIEGLTRALAAELAPTIRVNCIAPSLTDTPLAAALLNNDQKKEANAQRHPLKRIGKADDIANMAAFLLSEKAGWLTGQIIHVDGGMSALKT